MAVYDKFKANIKKFNNNIIMHIPHGLAIK